MNALSRWPNDAFRLLANGLNADADDGGASSSRFDVMWREARSIADRERFLHWEVAFPGVWKRWQDARSPGGFDAVIGNPPWDHIEQPEVEWFAMRDDDVALASTGAERKALIRRRLRRGDMTRFGVRAGPGESCVDAGTH